MSVPSSKLAPPKVGGGGQHSLAGEGARGANLVDWRESLAVALYLLCEPNHTMAEKLGLL